MRLDKLTIRLRPRPHAQALDLGFALLHEHASLVYRVWLTLWLPLMLLAMLLAWLLPAYAILWAILPWCLRPILERAPLYVLSRQVFGERVGWRQALRAWPGQLGGGALHLLTWGRPLATARGLYQAVWMLEGARGGSAAARRRLIGRHGCGRAAWFFGLACAHFEIVLQLGLLGGLSLFLTPNGVANPFYLLSHAAGNHASGGFLIGMLCYAISVGIVGPIYTACCFTLYLNRRATLEAWDLEIVLRQIEPPAQKAGAARALLLLATPVLLASVLTSMLLTPSTARAASATATATAAETATVTVTASGAAPQAQCEPPQYFAKREFQSVHAAHDATQAALRQELRQLYDSDALRGYVCSEHWRLKDRNATQANAPKKLPDLHAWALAVKAVLIASALAALGWLAIRYRAVFSTPAAARGIDAASEIGGLDIRPETLPDDVAGQSLQLWDAGQQRAALALLYRATLSRLVEHDGLLLYRGATEGDCLRLATLAARDLQLSGAKAELTAGVTDLWLAGAYGGHWPQRAVMAALCASWQAQFTARSTAHSTRQFSARGTAEKETP